MATYATNQPQTSRARLRALMFIPLVPVAMIVVGYLVSLLNWHAILLGINAFLNHLPEVLLAVLLLALTIVAVRATDRLARAKRLGKTRTVLSLARSTLFSVLVSALTFLFVFPLNAQLAPHYPEAGPYTATIQTSATTAPQRLHPESIYGDQDTYYSKSPHDLASGFSTLRATPAVAKIYRTQGAAKAAVAVDSYLRTGSTKDLFGNLTKRVPIQLNGKRVWAYLTDNAEYVYAAPDGSGFTWDTDYAIYGVDGAGRLRIASTKFANWRLDAHTSLASSSNPIIAFWGHITTS